MTHPGDETHAYLREEFKVLRTTVHNELAAMGTRFDRLADEMRTQNAVVAPQIAVLTHRLGEHDKDIDELKRTRLQDKADRQWSTGLKVTVAGIALSVVVALVLAVLNLTLGG
ncbi:hypothetical protein [Amycolatopsis thermoflava]|uniref:hypothetical protein n=1 Tax=Amycolatopsis thermoflava TaxID=84480 RepID=UPI003F49CDA9